MEEAFVQTLLVFLGTLALTGIVIVAVGVLFMILLINGILILKTDEKQENKKKKKLGIILPSVGSAGTLIFLAAAFRLLFWSLFVR